MKMMIGTVSFRNLEKMAVSVRILCAVSMQIRRSDNYPHSPSVDLGIGTTFWQLNVWGYWNKTTMVFGINGFVVKLSGTSSIDYKNPLCINGDIVNFPKS